VSQVTLLNRIFFLAVADTIFISGNGAPLLITEIAYPSHRAPLTSLYNSVWLGLYINYPSRPYPMN
jgi:hypothetical protein